MQEVTVRVPASTTNLGPGFDALGRRTVKVVPRPTSDSTLISPPCRCTMPKATLSPRPLPRSPLVVKKGSNRRRRTASLMPSAGDQAYPTGGPGPVGKRNGI